MEAEPQITPAMTADESSFISWLSSRGADISSAISLTQFPAMGRGVIASRDISNEELLFSVPRTTLLTTATSRLPSLLPSGDWDSLTGWTPLILVLMYESLQPISTSNWSSYFALLPLANSFDSLMFWSMDELGELEGSMVVGKIGKEEAENDWVSEVMPLVEKFPSIFGSKALYSLELFHHMGSLVLSRSFHVESGEENEDSEDDDDEEEEVESIGDIAMVPLADLLNALSTTSNARLFYSPLALEMRSTAPIAAGEQIFNTYANPPNSDLLRRYGHVDEVNEHDLVEIGLEKVVDLVGGQMGLDEVERESRAEWLLDMGIDDTFSITTSHAIPEELISTIRAFTASPTEFVKYQTKESPPRGKMDAEVSQWATKLLLQREEEYKTTIEEDELLLQPNSTAMLRPRHRMAILVRLSEKRILRSTREQLAVEWPTEAGAVAGLLAVTNKRSREDKREGMGKKPRK